MMIQDYEKQVYTSILGKVIGVYLGRPFEGWSKEQSGKSALKAKEGEEIRTRRLALQPFRTLPENLADLPEGCDKCGKKNSKGDAEWWIGYKLYLDVSDSGIPLSAILNSASVHDRQVFRLSFNNSCR